MFTNAPALKIAYPDERFVVCIDACNQGICGVLNQKGHVINYESKKMKEHEHNYATHNLELATIVHSLNMWRHYLMDKKFEPRTGHDGLKYMSNYTYLYKIYLQRSKISLY